MLNTNAQHVEVAIIGAGFSGLCVAIRLQEAGISDFVIFDAADELGGTWRDNSYPGCACDVPSHLYSFSFFPKTDWSRTFSGYAEIFAYMKACAAHYGLEPYFRFGTGIAEARFLEAEGLWQVTTDAGAQWTARFLVGATGGLSDPFVPELPGQGTFAGPQFHSQAWDHDLDLEGKRVAVIGTGASAVQFVPEIAKVAGAVDLYQRTPPWILKRGDRAFSEGAKRRFQNWPGWRWLYRTLLYWKAESVVPGFVRWPGLLRLAQPMVRRHIRKTVRDPEVARALVPNYTIGCKRILMSNDYYPAFNLPQLQLVTDGIAEIEAAGVRARTGELRPADVLIYATGFRATEYLSKVHITGRGGKSLQATWEENGGEAYKGTCVAGFPNLFLMSGPNTGLGHTSVLHIYESQTNYVLSAILALREQPGQWAEVRPEVQTRYNVRLQRRLGRTVWQRGGCQSWYQMETGKNTTLWPGSTHAFRRLTRRFDLHNYLVQSARTRTDQDPATEVASLP